MRSGRPALGCEAARSLLLISVEERDDDLDAVHVRQGGGAGWLDHFKLNLAELINVSSYEVYRARREPGPDGGHKQAERAGPHSVRGVPRFVGRRARADHLPDPGQACALLRT